MKKTLLNNIHHELEAKMLEFAGWEMPFQYSSMKEEAKFVREHAGIFDVSHMGQFLVSGDQALEAANYLITNDVSVLGSMESLYSPMCHADGGIIDDLIVYCIDSSRYLFVVNAGNKEKDWEWMTQYTQNFDCNWNDLSEQFSLIALQGPKALEIFKKAHPEFNQEAKKFSLQIIQPGKVMVATTGYTGEAGVEIFVSNDLVESCWKNLTELGAKPCGLGARDILRIEAGYPLYSQELTNEFTPIESNLKWATKLEKTNFIGKKAIEEKEKHYKLIKLTLEKGMPRTGQEVYLDDQKVGEITSGTHSVVLAKGIAIARVKSTLPNSNNWNILIRNKKYAATKVKSFI